MNLQFYLVFPILARWWRLRGPATLLVVAMVGMLARVLLNPILVPHQLNLLHTVFGYLPELCVLLISLTDLAAVLLAAHLVQWVATQVQGLSKTRPHGARLIA